MSSPYEPPVTLGPFEADERGPLRPGTGPDRVGAWIVDRLVGFDAVVFGQIVGSSVLMAAWTVGLASLFGSDARLLWATQAPAILLPVALALYQTWLLATTGQTIGRRAHAIRVIAEDGGRARPSVVVAQALLRSSARLLLPIGFVVALANTVPGLPDAPGWPYLERFVGLALLVAIGVLLVFDVVDVRNGQALHDRLLHTRLVRGRHYHPPQPAPRLRFGLVVALVIALGWYVSLRV